MGTWTWTGSEDVKTIVEFFVFRGRNTKYGISSVHYWGLWATPSTESGPQPPPMTCYPSCLDSQGAHLLKCVCTRVWDMNVCCISREFVNASWAMRRNSGLEGLSYGVHDGNCASALNFDHNLGKTQPIFWRESAL